jgi:hypothetical protein
LKYTENLLAFLFFFEFLAFQLQCGRIHRTAHRTTASEWNLHTGEGSREWRKRINFDVSFSQTPAIIVGFSVLDIVNSDDFRANVEADNITTDGFDLKIGTWGETEVWSVAVSWIAYDKTRASQPGTMIYSGRVSFGKSRTPNYNLHEGYGLRSVSQHIDFSNKFHTTPSVIPALCLIDILNDANSCVKVTVENVNSQGFDLRLTTWSDSHIWSIAAAWIAIDGALTRALGGRIQVGTHEFRQTHAAYQLHKSFGPRSLTEHILFAKAFVNHPKTENVCSWLCGFDIGIEDNVDLRLSTSASNPTGQGFELQLATWKDTKVFWGMCSWLVFGDGEPLPPPANNNNNVNENEQRAAKKQKIGDNVAKTTKTDGIFGTFICLCSIHKISNARCHFVNRGRNNGL